MATLIAYAEDGRIIATLDGIWRGVKAVDLEASEAAGDKLRAHWDVSGAVGSGSWPENLGAAALDYRVELDPAAPHRIVAIVHRETGHRRERSDALAAADRGGPGRPTRI